MRRCPAYRLVDAYGEREPDQPYRLTYAPNRRRPGTDCPDGWIEPVTGAPSFPLIGKIIRWRFIEGERT